MLLFVFLFVILDLRRFKILSDSSIMGAGIVTALRPIVCVESTLVSVPRSWCFPGWVPLSSGWRDLN